ncbi:unnamed protein product [Prunus armeniaca]
MEGVEEQVAEEAVTEEGGAKEDAADEMLADVVDQCLVNCLRVSGLWHVWPTSGDFSMRVARLAYIHRRVDKCDSFGLRPETCR